MSIFLLIDLGYVAIHVAHVNGFLDNPLSSLEQDRGYAELFLYTKLTLCIGLSILLYRMLPAKNLVSFALVFAYLIIDDALILHEAISINLAEMLNTKSYFGIPTREVLQLVVGIGIGLVLLAFVTLSIWRTPEGQSKRLGNSLLLCLLALGGFGVFIDAIHAAMHALGAPGWLSAGLVGLEDGGEMLSITAALALLLDEFYLISTETLSQSNES